MHLWIFRVGKSVLNLKEELHPGRMVAIVYICVVASAGQDQ